MRTALRVLHAYLRRRPLELEGVDGTGHRTFLLTPRGQIIPPMAGGDKTPEEIAAEVEAAEQKAEEDKAAEEAAEAEAQKKAEEEDPDSPNFKGEFDADKAKRLIANERKRAKERLEKAQKAAADAEARAKELEQAQETEHETAKRERDEAKVENERLRATTEKLKVDAAIRDAAADLDVPAKKVKRLLRLVDREGITVDSDGDADGAAEAVESVLEEFPEFKEAPVDPDDGDGKSEPPGGAPDRKRKPDKELSAEQVQKMAKEDPERFNELFEAGKIPEKALAGLK